MRADQHRTTITCQRVVGATDHGRRVVTCDGALPCAAHGQPAVRFLTPERPTGEATS